MSEPTHPPTEPASQGAQPQRAVWFFVTATFIFALPTLFMPEAEWWVRALSLAIGFVFIAGGGYYLSQELKGRRSPRPDDGQQRE